MLTLYENIKARRRELGMSQQELAEKVGYTDRSSIAKIETGKVDLSQSKIKAIADALGTTYVELMGDDATNYGFPTPEITEDVTVFPVIGEIAAGYDHIALEDYDGETIEIPNRYLKGHVKEDFFVLRVSGDSMYPAYQDGDRVLILKQTTLNYSGQVGAVLYDDDHASLKRVEYVDGQNWLRLVPINPNVAPERIEGERLNHCRILGVPKLLLRELS